MPSEFMLEELLGAIVTWIADNQGYVTKTKLLKLLYLFDVDFFRVHRRIFTDFSWKFFHLGPWAPEYDSVLESAIAKGIISRRNSNSEYDVSLLYPKERVETESIFSNVRDESVLHGVLNLWALSSTGEILDYVYFQTTPMESAIRNQPLDFSVIPEEKPLPYVRASSGKTKVQIQKLREAFDKRQRESNAKHPSVFEFTPPRYDDEFLEAMGRIEAS